MQRSMTGLWVLPFALLAWLAVAGADTLTVTVSRANVRQGPGLAHGVMATLPRGATFPVLGTQSGWHRIQLDDGRRAWIADSVVRVDASGPSRRALERRPEGDSQRRLALVIGNAAYADAPLRNPVNDAIDVAAALRQLGFEVELLRDAGRRQMQDAVRTFGRRLAQGGAGLFYYAGHGLQVAGQNYLVPIGANVQAEFDVEHETVPASWILGAMEYAGNGLNLVILDACRNNPYSRGFRGRSLRGLAAPAQTAKGSLIAYATSPNAVADDGAGRNGLYTKHLLRYMKEPGLGVEEMFKKVRIAVERESGGRQTPWELSSLTGDFSFTLAAAAPGVSDAEAQRLAEERQRVAAERQRLEAERQLLEEQRRLAEERRQLEEQRREAEERARREAAAEAERRRGETEAGRLFRDCNTCPEMIVVPAGSYMMGSPPGEEGRVDYEGPQHRVTIAESFAVGVHEITRGEFARFVRESNRAMGNTCVTEEDGDLSSRTNRTYLNPAFSQRDDHPVVCVNWDDAQAYVQWLSRKTRQSYRLLSEAEWEYVARAGTRGAQYWQNRQGGQCRHANGADLTAKRNGMELAQHMGEGWTVASCDDGYYQTAPTGSFTGNGFGLYDVHGNVWEWTQDCWHDNYSGAPRHGRSWESGGDCSKRVLRGGSWVDKPAALRAAFRAGFEKGTRFNVIGFRIARTLTP
ncbi:MAG: SUMF1/EgtB/PvdO family nonheme iron enzyme [Candidatus Tectomicrobia bacterium]|nr:SUMF1/EgtB/PvdO family nonheme iron enzyme [Candidatus Tectomicrobia bacterium]